LLRNAAKIHALERGDHGAAATPWTREQVTPDDRELLLALCDEPSVISVIHSAYVAGQDHRELRQQPPKRSARFTRRLARRRYLRSRGSSQSRRR